MQPTNKPAVLDVVALDLLTDEEKAFNKLYVERLVAFANGEGNIDRLKVMAAGALAIASRQRARCVVAALISANKIQIPAHAAIEPKTSIARIRGEGGKMLLPPKQCLNQKCKKIFTPDTEKQEYCGECEK
jgi:hypothetical protein